MDHETATMREGEVFSRRSCRPAPFSWCGLVAAAALLFGCDASLPVGSWKCIAAPLFIPPDGSPALAGKDTTIETGWGTGFEDGFCGYSDAVGYCYSDSDAKFEIVTDPSHSGRRAAAFTVDTEEPTSRQARCVREGKMPKDAIFGAWFFIPRGHENNGNWNLMHFRTATEEGFDGILDLSLSTNDDGELEPSMPLYAGDAANNNKPPTTRVDVTLPYDEWFSLGVRILRDTGEEGIAAVYFNGDLVIERRGVVTDREAEWGQWYLGNLADNLDPPLSTIYIDDVSIRESSDDTP